MRNFYTKNIQRVGREWMKVDLQQFSFTIGVISNKSNLRAFHILILEANDVKAPISSYILHWKKDSFEKETTQGDLHRCVEIGESKYRNWCPGKLVIVNTER